jgi:hypothetical protein
MSVLVALEYITFRNFKTGDIVPLRNKILRVMSKPSDNEPEGTENLMAELMYCYIS